MSSLMAGTLMMVFGIAVVAIAIIIDMVVKAKKLVAIPPEEVPERFKVAHVFYADDTNQIYVMENTWRATQHTKLINREADQLEGLVYLGEL